MKNKSISDEISSLFTRKSLAESDSDEGELNLVESVEIQGEKQVGDIHKQNAPLLEEISSRYKGIPSSRDIDSDSSGEQDTDDSEDEENDEVEEEEDVSENDSAEDDESGSESVQEFPNESDAGETTPNNIKLISQKSKENDVKGHCVKNQLKMWENLLEVRIRSQSLMTLSNRLPFPDKFRELQESSENFSSLASEVQNNLTNVINQLIETQNTLISAFPDTRDSLKRGLYSKASLTENEDEDEETTPKKPKLEFSSNTSSESFRKLYRNIIGKWTEKTNLGKSSGSPIDQIDKVLSRKSDLVENSRTCKGNYSLFRVTSEEISEESGRKSSPEIYDDTDFYQEILSELIEAKSSQNLDGVTSSTLQKKARNSTKKIVDTKASKGRRIR